MASYLTGSEAFTREKQATPEISTSSTAAWADKYRGVRLSQYNHPAPPQTNTKHRQQLKISILPRRSQSPPMTPFPQP